VARFYVPPCISSTARWQRQEMQQSKRIDNGKPTLMHIAAIIIIIIITTIVIKWTISRWRKVKNIASLKQSRNN